MPFILSRADDKNSTDQSSIHLQVTVLPENRNSQFLRLICWLSIIFGICFLLARTIPIPQIFFRTIKKVVKMDSAKRSLNVFRQLENYFFPQDLDWTLVFVSFLSRYPSDTDNQIYSNSKTRIWNPILLVFIWCTASFRIFLWSSPFAHQCFVHYHSIAPGKILNLDGLSLVSYWKPCLFYGPLCRF